MCAAKPAAAQRRASSCRARLIAISSGIVAGCAPARIRRERKAVHVRDTEVRAHRIDHAGTRTAPAVRHRCRRGALPRCKREHPGASVHAVAGVVDASQPEAGHADLPNRSRCDRTVAAARVHEARRTTSAASRRRLALARTHATLNVGPASPGGREGRAPGPEARGRAPAGTRHTDASARCAQARQPTTHPMNSISECRAFAQRGGTL